MKLLAIYILKGPIILGKNHCMYLDNLFFTDKHLINFNRCTVTLNSELTGCLPNPKERSLPYYLPMTGGENR